MHRSFVESVVWGLVFFFLFFAYGLGYLQAVVFVTRTVVERCACGGVVSFGETIFAGIADCAMIEGGHSL